MKKTALPIIAAGLWITASEFIRNQFLFKGLWVEHYRSLGLGFETRPLNGILWMVWSFLLACGIFALLPKFSFAKAVVLAWIPAFVLMWITLFNLQVLPLKLLLPAVPLSLLEAAVAGFILKKTA
jgi:hypothetical protein